jgi:hypothetical protein
MTSGRVFSGEKQFLSDAGADRKKVYDYLSKTYAQKTWPDDDLTDTCGFKALYTECNSGGVVEREIGIDSRGKVIYRFPLQMLDGQRGMMDSDQSDEDLTAGEFEVAWKD